MNNTTTIDSDRFGIPESAFEAARRSHGVGSPVLRAGMYVPTRAEVATWEPKPLTQILIDWFYECPTELIPNDTQVRDVLAILKSRVDANEFESFIEYSERELLSSPK